MLHALVALQYKDPQVFEFLPLSLDSQTHSYTKDMDRGLTSGYNMNVSFTYSNIYMKCFKDNLKQTMLEHESIFEDQIHELHRLYWKQKKLMVEMEGTTSHSQPRPPESLYPFAGFSQPLSQDCPRASEPWMMMMKSRISTPRMSLFPHKEPSSTISGTYFDKSGKKVLDLESPPDYEYLNIGEPRSVHDREIHEASNSWKEQSPRSISMESDFQLDKLHQFTGSSKLKRVPDLNEPAEEEPLEFESNQFMNPVTDFCTASNEIAGESNSRNDGGHLENGSHRMKEVQDQLLSTKCRTDIGIDLNTSPRLSEEQASIPEKIEHEQVVGRSRMVVQALPCSRGITSLQKGAKPLFRSSRSCKKAKRGRKNMAAAVFLQSGTRKGSDLDSSLGVSEDDDHLPSTASYVHGMDLQAPVRQHKKKRTRPDNKSGNYQACGKRRNSGSLADVESVRKKESCQTKKSRSKLRNIKSFINAEEDDQERAAAETIVEISSSIVHTTCVNLHWFALIASSVVDDCKSEFGLSVSGCHNASNVIDKFEAMALKLTETAEVEEHNSLQKTNTEDHGEFVINGKHRNGRSRQGKRRYKDIQHGVLLKLASFLRNEVATDLQTIGRQTEATGTKWNHGCSTNKIKNGISMKGRRRQSDSPTEPIDVSISANHEEEKRVVVDWGTVTRRRRGPRVPAASFQLVLSQV